MAEIKQAVIIHLNNDPTVHAAFAHRITADKIPDGQTYPHARLWVVTSPQQYTMQGEGGHEVMVQIDVFDDDLAGADANTELIKASLSGFRGQMGSVNAGHVFVSRGPGTWNEEARNFRRILEVKIGTNN